MKESPPKSTITWSEMGTTNNEGKEVYSQNTIFLKQMAIILGGGIYITVFKSVISSGEFSSTKPSDWEVRLGEHSFLSVESHEKHLRVVEIRVHPNYIPGNLTHPGDYDVGKSKLRLVPCTQSTCNSYAGPGGGRCESGRPLKEI